MSTYAIYIRMEKESKCGKEIDNHTKSSEVNRKLFIYFADY